jgi:hypothetical protein
MHPPHGDALRPFAAKMMGRSRLEQKLQVRLAEI